MVDDALRRIRDRKIEDAIARSKPNISYNKLLQNANPARQVIPTVNPAYAPRSNDVNLMIQLPAIPLNMRATLGGAPTQHLYRLIDMIKEILESRPDAKN